MNTTAELPDPLTPSEVAAALRVGRTLVYGLVAAGKIRHLRVGDSRRPRILIYRADLEAFIETHKRGESK